ncbi:MAG: hypothetical protein DRP02_02300 [Candidatus Gerdarchaeota archaeon]|nr:MAG: hypothetical protein DRP02_02300 [Candidatus Gerdarchaeota archaeon]
MKKTIRTAFVLICFFALGVACNHFHPIRTKQINIKNWQTIDGNRYILKSKSDAKLYALRKEFNDKFNDALEERGIYCNQFQHTLESNTNFLPK